MTDVTPSAAAGSEQEVDVAAAAVTDGAYTLFVADFSDEQAAMDVYHDLKSLEDGATVELEGVLVVKKDAGGKIEIQKTTDHSTRRGLGWGVVGGVVLGVIFPPSIIGSAVVLGGAGAATGKLRERHHNKELAEQLQDAIEPGHSGIIALVSDPGAVRIQKALAAADGIVQAAVDKTAAQDIKAAAKAADGS